MPYLLHTTKIKNIRGKTNPCHSLLTNHPVKGDQNQITIYPKLYRNKTVAKDKYTLNTLERHSIHPERKSSPGKTEPGISRALLSFIFHPGAVCPVGRQTPK
jgi:hypothetical protein